MTDTFSIKKAIVTPAIEGVADKIYDGNTTVTSSLKIRLNGIVKNDDVYANANFLYEIAEVGEKLPVTACDIMLYGENASNYELSSTSVTIYTGVIRKKFQIGWVKNNNKWYYYNANGVMQTGWVKVSGKWYYMNGSGVMQTGKKVINGKNYVFNQNGQWIQ